MENVARIAAYLRQVLPLGEHRIPGGAKVLPLEDLGHRGAACGRAAADGGVDDELIAAVGGGMVKVNIGTALNSGTVRGTLEDDAALVAPRRHLASARTAMPDTLASVLRLLAATTTRAG